MRTAFSIIIACLAALTLSSSTALSTTVTPTQWIEDFGSGYSSSSYQITGSAQRISDAFRLTPDESMRLGRIGCVQQYDVTAFRASFRFRIVAQPDSAADGFVFHWYPGLNPPAEMDGQLGWVSNDSAGFGLELDTWHNSNWGDPSSAPAHIALTRHGIREHLAWTDQPSVEDGNWHSVQLAYDNGDARVWMDGSLVLSATVPVEFDEGYFMFSAATGTHSSEQWIDDITLLVPSSPPRVTSPNGGESWAVGETHHVTWTRSPLAEKVRIELNRSYPSGVWETISDSTSDDGVFSWNVTGPRTTTARTRITSVENPQAGDTSDADFTVLAPFIQVLTPNGGEIWYLTNIDTIRWISLDLAGYVYIEVNRDFPSGSWEYLASSLSNSGEHLWRLTGTATPNARVRVRSAVFQSVADISDTSFVVASPTISVLSPNGGETRYVTNGDTIRWTSEHLAGNVKIELNRSYPAGAWENIISNTANDGIHVWTVTSPATASARMRVTSLSEASVSDLSDADFFVTTPTLAVMSPNGGEARYVSNLDTIRWTSAHLWGNVNVELNRSYPGETWEPVALNTINDGVHEWTVTGPVSSTARVRITSVIDSTVTDGSDSDFNIVLPTLTLVTPNGGETRYVTNTDTIRWTAPHLNGNVTVELNRTFPTGAWESIAANTAYGGVHVWTVSGPASSTARMRVTSVSVPGVADTSDGDYTILLPTITVVSPNGGEVWFMGRSQQMTWIAAGVEENLRIELNRDYPAGIWETLVASTPDDGEESVLVPGPVAVHCRIRMSTVSGGVAGESNADFAIVQPAAITLDIRAYIDGVDSLIIRGSTIQWHHLAWAAPGRHGGQNLPTVITTTWNGEVQMDHFQWIPTWPYAPPDEIRFEARSSVHDSLTPVLPSCPMTVTLTPLEARNILQIAQLPSSANGHTLVLYFDDDAGGTVWYRALVSIDTLWFPLALQSPNGGESWTIGETRNISWSSTGSLDSVSIEINRNYPVGGWEVIASSTLNDSSYSWTVTGPATSTARIRVSSTSDTLVRDTSDADFAIVAPCLTVTSPNGGEVWPAGETFPITWTWNGPPDSVRIEIKINYDSPYDEWTTIAVRAAGDESYGWRVRRPITTDARIRIMSLGYPACGDTSDANFTISEPNLAPHLLHDPLADFIVGTGTVVAQANDDIYRWVTSVKMFWRLVGALDYDSLDLMPTSVPYEYAASLAFLETGVYQYYVRATDGGGNRSYVPNGAPVTVLTFDVAEGCGSELAYDDGSAELFNWSWGDDGTNIQWAARFGPVTPPFAMCGVRFAASRSLPDSVHSSVRVRIYAADGPGGYPGTLLKDVITGSVGNVPGGLPLGTNWAQVFLTDDLGDPLVLNVPEFYVSVSNIDAMHYEAFGRDTDGSNWHRSYFYDPCVGQWFSEDDTLASENAFPGNRLIRVSGYTIITFTLQAPNGGETLLVGDTSTIRWTSTGTTEHVRIALNRGYPSGAWEIIADSVANTGAYDWVVSEPLTVHARMRTTGTVYTGVGDTSAADFEIGARTVSVLSPNGGEIWLTGDVDTIRWNSTHLDESIRIELNRDYPAGAWETIAASTESDGAHPWTVDGPIATAARMRISGTVHTQVSDTSDETFVIGTRTLSVQVPNGGETRYVTNPDTIRWSTQFLSGNVNIELNRSFPGDTWESLAANTSNTGSHIWTVFGPASPQVRVRISSVNWPWVSDTSDADFAIARPTLTVAVPNGGETRYVTNLDTIRWTSLHLSGNVNVELNRSYPGEVWEALATNTPNDGSHPWIVTSPVTSTARVRITSVSDPAVADTGNGDFSIDLPAVTLIAPNGGETRYVTNTDTIRWTAPHLNDNVTIEVNRTFPTGAWENVATNTANDGVHVWTVSGPVSSTARMRVTSVSVPAISDTSDADFAVLLPAISLLSPNGSETRYVTNGDTIRWTSEHLAGNVKIELNRSYPAGAWENIISNTANDGIHVWTVTSPATASARMRVTSLSEASVSDLSDADFSIAMPTLTVMAPNGGETWYVGETDTIRWSSQHLSGNVKIEMNRAYPSGSWESVTSNTPNDGVHPWVVSAPVTSAARIRVSSVSASQVADTSDESFTIALPTVVVVAPNGGETWYVTNVDTMRWTSAHLTGNVKIELNRSYPGGAWETIVSSTTNDGVHPWTVNTPATALARVRITSVSVSGVLDVSDGEFTIEMPTLTVVSPNGGEVWSIGEPHAVSWSAPYLTGNVRIELNRSYPGGSWVTIATTSNMGSYLWTPSYPATSTARIRIASESYASIADSSDADFTLPPPSPDQLPGTVSNPFPSDSEVAVVTTPLLSWRPADRALLYDLYLWPDTASEPGTPTVNDLGDIRYQIPAPLQYGRTYRWRIVAENLYGQTPGPVWRFTVRTLPDLTVAQVLVPQEAYSGQSYQVSWVISNVGSAGTSVPEWYDALYLCPQPDYNAQLATYLGRFLNPSYLPPGESYLSSATFTLPQGVSGDYYVFVRTDELGHLAESNESNNFVRCQTPMHVVLTPPPDLRVTAIVTPNNAFSGQNVSVSWTVRNLGTGTTIVGSWSDAVYVSPDSVFNTNAVQRASIPHSGVLLPDSGYNGFAIVALPQAMYGDFYVYVATDIGNQVYEFVFEGNNRSRSDSISVMLTPPPDLIVTSVVIPPAGTAGQSIPIQFTIQNAGPGAPFENGWQDRVYLSADSVLNLGSATVLGTFSRSGSLEPGAAYSRDVNVTLPSGSQGPKYVFVTTDWNNQVFEHLSDANNTTRGETFMNVAAVPWPDLIVTVISAPALIGSGDSLSVGWTVRNQGPGATAVSAWQDRVYVSACSVFHPDSAIVTGSFARTGTLAPDASYSMQRRVMIPDSASGAFHIFVMTDATGQVSEYLYENNNVSENDSLLQINLTPWADLVVSGVTIPPSGLSGRSIAAQWAVQNQGTGATRVASWTDGVYLSAAPAFHPDSALLLKSVVHDGALGQSGSYAVQDSVPLPNGVAGEYYLFVVTDAASGVYEYRFDGNNVARSDTVVQITLSPWPDLQITTLNVPSEANAGQSLSVGFAVTNSGAAATPVSSWRDKVYLSSSPTWSASTATLLATLQHAGSLMSDSTYAVSTTLSLSAQLSGTYYIYVFTDADSALFECTGEDNNIRRSDPVLIHPYPVDIAVTAVGAPDSAWSGQNVTLQWTVTNVGPVRTLASSWQDAVYLSLDSVLSVDTDLLMATVSRTGILNPGQSYTRDHTHTLPNGFSGTYYVIVRTDPNNQVSDVQLSNNAGACAHSTVIQLTPPPNMQIASFTLPVQATAGQPAAVSWTIRNGGTGSTPVSLWYDAVYLSTNNVLDGADTRLGTFTHNGVLLPDSTYAVSAQVSIPSWTFGNVYLILKTDNNDLIYEHSGEGDNVSVRPLSVYLPPPCDLVVRNIVLPESAVPGQTVSVSWTIVNQGTNPAVGWMRDAVYFSPDTLWDISDALLGLSNRYINIAPGRSEMVTTVLDLSRVLRADPEGNLDEERSGESGSAGGAMPGVPLGSYHALVRTDIRNNISESNNLNNTSASDSTIAVDVEALELGVPETGTLTSAQPLYYRVEVQSDLDLRIVLDAQAQNSVNEMYVAFGRIPTLSNYDFSAAAPFTADQEVLIPTNGAGNYYILILPRGQATNYTLTAVAMPFSIVSITPDHGGQGGTATCTIRGAGFADDVELFLRTDTLQRSIELLEVKNSTELVARVNLQSLDLGCYRVQAITPDSSIAEMPGCFVVEPLVRNKELPAVVSAPGPLRIGGVATYEVFVTNVNNVDADFVGLIVAFPANQQAIVESEAFFGTPIRQATLDSIENPSTSFVSSGIAIITAMAKRVPPGQTVRAFVRFPNARAGSDGNLAVYVHATAVTREEFLVKQLAGLVYLRDLVAASDPDSVTDAARSFFESDSAFADFLNIIGEANLFGYGPLTLPTLPLTYFPSARSWDALDRCEFIVSGVALIAGGALLLAFSPAATATAVAVVVYKVSVALFLIDAAVYTSDALVCQRPDPPEGVCNAIGAGDVVLDVAEVGWGVRAIRVLGATVDGIAGLIADAVDLFARPICSLFVRAYDPNMITGPVGYGDAEYVPSNQLLPYTIHFENDPALATAPAQIVRVTQPLDSTLNPASFRLGSFGFGSFVFNVPQNRAYYSQRLDVRDSLGVYVDVTAGINVTTNEAFWIFESVDPATGEVPVNPLAGFLAINDSITHRGEGFVTYTIQSRSDAQTGDTIHAQARIVFDVNEPIDTPPIFNTADADPPTSCVDTSLTAVNDTTIIVHWTGADDGSGIASYDFYVSANRGPFEVFQSGITDTFLLFTGWPYNYYEFFTIARDNVGYEEAMKSTSETSVYLAPAVPAAPITDLTARVEALGSDRSLMLYWSAVDEDTSGRAITVSEYRIYSRSTYSGWGGLWELIGVTTDTSLVFPIPLDDPKPLRYFQVMAVTEQLEPLRHPPEDWSPGTPASLQRRAGMPSLQHAPARKSAPLGEAGKSEPYSARR